MELASDTKPIMIAGTALSTLAAIFQLSPYLAVFQVMAELLRHAGDIQSVNQDYMIHWALFGLVGLILGYVFMYIGGMIGHIAAFKALYSIRMKLADHISKLPLGWFGKNSTGKVKQIAEGDVEQLELFLAHQFPDIISTVTVILSMTVIMFSLDVWLALASLLPILVGFVVQFSFMFGKKAQEGLKEYYDALENINTSSIQYVRGMPSIKIFGQTVHSFRKFYDDIVAYRDMNTKFADHYEPCYVFFRVFVLSIAVFIVPVGMFFLSKDPTNMAYAITLLFMLVFAPGIATPVFKFNNFGSAFNNINEGVRRIDEILLHTPVMEETDQSEKTDGYDITFDDVSFSYEAGRKVLNHVSFTAPQGKITALVGPSGSGKSTIAQLIPRFFDPEEGFIRIGGTDIRKFRTEDLMNTLSFVFQDCFLFSDTVYNNIALGKPGCTKEEVYAAARAAQCHDFILDLPSGYDTLIGEGGVYLSGGEEQRVSVARAILKNAPVLILDEATAYADPENEYRMQLALKELIQNKTVIIIAHRLSTIKNADQILVIKDGSVSEQGCHNELLDKNGLYRSMWDAYRKTSVWEIGAGKRKVVSES